MLCLKKHLITGEIAVMHCITWLITCILTYVICFKEITYEICSEVAPRLILATLVMKSSHLLEPLHITTMSSVISLFVMRVGKGSLSRETDWFCASSFCEV